MKVEQYTHHGEDVSVQSKLKGKHREHCLCYGCAFFNPGKSDNCDEAQRLYAILSDPNFAVLVAPVWECADFRLEESKREQYLGKEVDDIPLTRHPV